MMNNLLMYKCPAKKWEEALPIGGGELGAMVYGGTGKLKLQFNEISLWNGEPYKDADKPFAYEHLPELRALIDNKKYTEAAELLDREFTNNGGGFEGAYSGSYQTFGELNISSHIPFVKTKEYCRTLDLQNAVCRDSFKYNGAEYEREYFSSHADKIIAVRFSSDKEKNISLSMSYERKDIESIEYSEKGLRFNGHCDGNINHMAFAAGLNIYAPGGTVKADKKKISVTDADEVIMYYTAATDYIPDQSLNFKSGDPVIKCEEILKGLSAENYNEIKNRHINDYSPLYASCTIDLESEDMDYVPTDKRLKRLKHGRKDPGMVELLFNYGRYLFLSSSREDNILPANLQGIWCKDYQAPWHCDYHTNINVQMNYWCAGPANMTSGTEPFAKFICSLTENGAKTAKAYYNADGWTLYTISNPYFWTSPGWGGGWSQYPLGGAWLCRHLVEYYNFTKDKTLLERFYPVIKSNCIFNISILYKTNDGFYITSPATSPENEFTDDDGNSGWVCRGTAMDIEMLYENFTDMIMICDILGKDEDLKEKLITLKKSLLPLKIGKAGQLCEWEGDWDLNAREMHHRHVSHLYGLHPGTMISCEKTPELADACRKTLELRGDDGTGWSLAWKINFRARLREGDRALKLINRLLNPVPAGTRNGYSGGGGVYINLFDAHPPFQIDGNFGAVAGICEMLLQSHVILDSGEYLIDVLPALPSSWKNGKVSGLIARGNTEMGIEWKNSKICTVTLKSRTGGRVAVKGIYECDETEISYENGNTFIDAEKNKLYILKTKEEII